MVTNPVLSALLPDLALGEEGAKLRDLSFVLAAGRLNEQQD